MPFTNDAVVFVSHFDVRPGHLDAAGVDLVIQPKALGGFLRTTVR